MPIISNFPSGGGGSAVGDIRLSKTNLETETGGEYLKCDGRLIDEADYPELYPLLGTTASGTYYKTRIGAGGTRPSGTLTDCRHIINSANNAVLGRALIGGNSIVTYAYKNASNAWATKTHSEYSGQNFYLPFNIGEDIYDILDRSGSGIQINKYSNTTRTQIGAIDLTAYITEPEPDPTIEGEWYYNYAGYYVSDCAANGLTRIGNKAYFLLDITVTSEWEYEIQIDGFTQDSGTTENQNKVIIALEIQGSSVVSQIVSKESPKLLLGNTMYFGDNTKAQIGSSSYSAINDTAITSFISSLVSTKGNNGFNIGFRGPGNNDIQSYDGSAVGFFDNSKTLHILYLDNGIYSYKTIPTTSTNLIVNDFDWHMTSDGEVFCVRSLVANSYDKYGTLYEGNTDRLLENLTTMSSLDNLQNCKDVFGSVYVDTDKGIYLSIVGFKSECKLPTVTNGYVRVS